MSGSQRNSSSNITRISRRARLAPRQKCGPPPPKPDVLVRGAGDVEAVRVVEHPLVTVRRLVPHDDLVALGDRDAVDLGVLGGGAAEVDHGGGPPDDLLDRGRRDVLGVGLPDAPAGRDGPVSALMPWVMALRVVSLPAAARRMKKLAISDGVSVSPSTSACIMADTRSSCGLASRSSPTAWAIWASVEDGAHQRLEVGGGGLVAEDDVGHLEDVVPLVVGDSHHLADDLERQRGGEVGRRRRTRPARPWRRRSARALTRTSSSMRATMRGVKARFTIIRTRV